MQVLKMLALPLIPHLTQDQVFILALMTLQLLVAEVGSLKHQGSGDGASSTTVLSSDIYRYLGPKSLRTIVLGRHSSLYGGANRG